MVIILTAKRRLEMKAHFLPLNHFKTAELGHMRRALELLSLEEK
jgi:hypothetical protein